MDWLIWQVISADRKAACMAVNLILLPLRICRLSKLPVRQ